MKKLDNKKLYFLIENLADIELCRTIIQDADIIAFDTETNGLNVRKNDVIGYSFSTKVDQGFYFPMLVWDGSSLQKTELYDSHKVLLKELCNKKLIMHNASYDTRIVINNLNVDMLDALHADTVLMYHTINEEGPFGLKDIAVVKQEELGISIDEVSNQDQLDLEANVKSKGGSWKKSNKEIYKADLNILAKYAACDTDLTLKLYHYCEQKLKDENLHDFFYVDEVMPLYKYVTIIMEHVGINLDMPNLIKYNDEIAIDIANTKKFVVESILRSEYGPKLLQLLTEQYPVNNKGSFAQALAEEVSLPLAKNEKGKFSLAAKNIQALPESTAKSFLLGTSQLSDSLIYKVKMRLLKTDEPDLINISSKQQLGKLAFDVMVLLPLSTTDKGTAQFNEAFLETIEADWATELRVYNKLNKIKGSYYERFLEQQEDGIFYPSFKQFATTSGRYGSDTQQLSRPVEEGSDDARVVKYINTLRTLFISPPDHVFIDDDYESLEPMTFSDDAGDKALIDIFESGEDFYSKVAIQAENIEGVSAHKKDKNFLKTIYPDIRQKAKAYSLGIRYGMQSFKLAATLNIEKEEAEEIIQGYFRAFPNLKNKMDYYLREAKINGVVKSKYGRVRHLPKVKAIHAKYKDDLLDYEKMRGLSKKFYKPMDELKELKREYKNLLNNALNFPIQSAAASIVNRAMIAMTYRFKKEDLNAWVCLQIHDQIVVTCSRDCIDRVKEVVQDCMENTNKLAMKLVAIPQVARNLRDGH